jgi:hypothetical protein
MEYDQDSGLTKQELDAFKTFYFAVFTSNPMRDKVTILIEDGLKVMMRRSAFVDLCVSLIGIQIQDRLTLALEEVGGFFLLDREKGTIKHLQPSNEHDPFNVWQVFQEGRKTVRDENKSLGVDPRGGLASLSQSLTSVHRTTVKKKERKRFRIF